jgi:anthraniloyl-CoA monooxygenase
MRHRAARRSAPRNVHRGGPGREDHHRPSGKAVQVRNRAGGAGRVTIVGAGPAGLFLARTLRLRSPGTTVDVYDRLSAAGTAGFGVSLSERTLRMVAEHDPETHRRIAAASVAQHGITVRLPARAVTYPGF